MIEARETALRRLRMRSMRRGIKEMDVILSIFAETRLDSLGDDDLALYDALLSENDQDLFRWVSGQAPPPRRYGALLAEIAARMRAAPAYRRV